MVEKFYEFKNITLVQRAYKAEYKEKIAPGNKVIENIVSNLSYSQLEKKIRFCIKNMDQNLVQDLLASTATRLNDIRRNGLIEIR